MKVTEITKGQIITAANGRRYTVLSTTPWPTGAASLTYVTMVRPIHVGRAFDLHISQDMLDAGAYAVTPAAK